MLVTILFISSSSLYSFKYSSPVFTDIRKLLFYFFKIESITVLSSMPANPTISSLKGSAQCLLLLLLLTHGAFFPCVWLSSIICGSLYLEITVDILRSPGWRHIPPENLHLILATYPGTLLIQVYVTWSEGLWEPFWGAINVSCKLTADLGLELHRKSPRPPLCSAWGILLPVHPALRT